MAPYMEKMPNVFEFIKSIKSGSQQFHGMGPQIFAYKIYLNNDMVTLNSNNSQGDNLLGFVVNKKEQLVAFGQFKEIEGFENYSSKEKVISYQNNYVLNGLGVQVLEGDIVDRKKSPYQQKVILSG